MSQITTGIRSILSYPAIYNILQTLLGASRARDETTNKYLDLEHATNLLDIGCGTGELLKHLPSHIKYTGFDASQDYIDAARNKFGNRGNFFASYVTNKRLDSLGKFDRIIAMALMHHLDDDEVLSLLSIAKQALNKGGLFFTLDPCFVEHQSFVSKFLVSRDRGQNVRTLTKYASLVKKVFEDVEVIHRDNLITLPYDHAIFVCRN